MTELDYVEIGRNIRKYRLSKGLKQKDLAEKINMSEQHISHIESARTKLSLPTLVAIANVLEIDCNSLLGSTLAGSRKAVLSEQIEFYLSEMGESKLGLCFEFCKLLSDYNLPKLGE